MKRVTKIFTLYLLILLAFGLFLTGCGQSGDKSETKGKESSVKTTTLNLDLLQTEGSPVYEGAAKFAELVKKYTEGRYEIKLFANAALGNGNQLTSTEMVQKGNLDMVITSFNWMVKSEPSLQLLNLPWLINGNDFIDKNMVYGTKLYSKLDKMLEKLNLKMLSIYELGWRELSNSVRPVSSPSDMKGLKLRAIDATTIESFTAMGANPTNISFGELYTALQQGAAEGQENPIASIFIPNRFYEVQKYLTIWDSGYTPLPLVINTGVWKSIDPADQEAIQKAATEAIDYQKKLIRNLNEQGIQTAKDKGVQITVLNEEQKAEFKKVVEPLYAKYFEKADPDMAKMLKEGSTN